jgi:prepilin-type N-terminal cleavage/methylation domain-containing protein
LKIGRNTGFTLIEALAVLTIIGLIGALAVSRAPSTDTYRLATEVQTLKGHLRYAQSRSMSDRVPWGITYGSGSYTLQKAGAPATNLPSEGSATHVFQGGVSITSAPGSVAFDQWGSPGSVNLFITLNGSETVTITRNTGFIP